MGEKGFVWERPFRGPVLGARVADEGVKAALIASEPSVFFTTPHFDDYPAVPVQLDHGRAGTVRADHRGLALPRPEAPARPARGVVRGES